MQEDDKFLQEGDVETPDEETWLARNEWIFAVLYLVVGPLIALKGLAWLDITSVLLAAVFLGTTVLSEGAQVGVMDTTEGTWFLVAVAAVMAVMAGLIARQNIYIVLRGLGAITGWYFGRYILSMVVVLTKQDGKGWWMYAVPAGLALLGAFSSGRQSHRTVIYTTSFIGSYIFVLAWINFFPQTWPPVTEEQELAVTMFWILAIVVGAGTLVSTIYQSSTAKVKSLDDDYKPAR